MIKRRNPIPRISAKKLGKLRDKEPFKAIRKCKRRKHAKPPNGLTFPGALDPRSKRWENGREELRGADKNKRRAEIFERAGGRCEEILAVSFIPVLITRRCPNLATEWSHKPCIHIGIGNGHGRGFKCDSISCGIASCKSCHQKFHGG